MKLLIDHLPNVRIIATGSSSFDLSNAYKQIYANSYFWRIYNRKEIDLVEERDGKLFGYEFKLSPKKLKAPGLWTEAYPDASFEVISRDNFLEFLI